MNAAGVANVERDLAAPERELSREPSLQDRPDVVSSAEGYRRWAASYDQNPNPLLAREERYFLPLLANAHNKRILDLACGTGRWLEKLAASGVEGVGIDCSAAMLLIARKKYPMSRLAGAGCESLPFASAVFDLAICSFALGHIQHLDSMLRELARVTKTGAEVFVSDLHPEAFTQGWRVGFRDDGGAVQIETIPRSTDEIIHAFCANGFECLAQEPLWLGAEEKPIFEAAGKSGSFLQACQFPAVFACQFKKFAPPPIERRSSEKPGAETLL